MKQYAYLQGCMGQLPSCPLRDKRFTGGFWHGHPPALVEARDVNRKAGKKVVKVVVRAHHFIVTPV